MATLGTMMQAAGYYTAYQGKWHLSNAYRTPANPGSTATALVPYGFSEFNDWGDIDGGAWPKVDPVIAGQAVRNIRAVLLAAGTHRPSTVDDLLHNNDVVLCDRRTDPGETVNLAGDPSHHALVTEYLHKLEALIDAEIGPDLDPLVTEKPVLLGAPRWRGDNT